MFLENVSQALGVITVPQIEIILGVQWSLAKLLEERPLFSWQGGLQGLAIAGVDRIVKAIFEVFAKCGRHHFMIIEIS